MSRIYLYLLTPTKEGDARRPTWDSINGMVVRAANSKHARTLGSQEHADEGPKFWLDGNLSGCRRLGEVMAGAKRTPEVVLRDGNWG